MIRTLLPLALAAVAAVPAQAQDATNFGVEVASDERRRGLSWSEGDAAVAADAFVARGAIEAGVRVVSLRDSARHGGAEAVADLELGATTDLGPIRARGYLVTHLFAGAAGKMDYAELGASASYSLGPLQVNAGAIYAPDQSAIGGSNLYLNLGASAGVPATPFTLFAGIGRSTGDTEDRLRAARLRPAGDYTDWRIGVEYVQAPFTFGVDYVGTDIREEAIASPFADIRNSGDRLLGRARISF